LNLVKSKISYINIIILIIFIFPFIYATIYAIPATDDFMLEKYVLNNNAFKDNRLRESLKLTWDAYTERQGCFTGYFLFFFLSVFATFGLTGYRAFCCITVLSFNCLLIILLFSLLKRICNIAENNIRWFISIITAVLVSNILVPKELYYWATGICIYTFPIIFGVLSLILYLRYKEIHSIRLLIGVMVLAFISTGGTLQIAAIFCYIYLLNLAYTIYSKNKKSIKVAISIFTIVLIGCMLNTVAPGNFIRHENIDPTGLHWGKAVINSLITVFLHLKNLCNAYIFILSVLEAYLFLKYSQTKKVKLYNHPISVGIIYMVSLIISIFPVALGYSQTSYFENRIEAVLYIHILFGLVFVIWSIVNYLKNKYFEKSIIKWLFIISILPIMMITSKVLFNNQKINYIPSFQCIREIKNGSIKQIADNEEMIIKTLASSDKKEVNFTIKQGNQTIIKELNLRDDSEYWTNLIMANYYNKKTITVKYID